MAAQNFLIMNLLRVITPEEIGDIATKHNGGKFLSLTDLVNERVEHNVFRDFSSADAFEEMHEQHNQKAKILPFKKTNDDFQETPKADDSEAEEVSSLSAMAEAHLAPDKKETTAQDQKQEVAHQENENMSSFILIEKERLKRSQQSLKQKEIIDLYQKNSNVDVEQIKGSNNNFAQAKEAGVLVNKKQY